jgi:flagellar protein FlbD
MIEVTRLGGERFFVNADHIESVEGQSDTNLILNNGKRLIVRESIAEVVHKVMEYQRLIRSGIPPLTPCRNEEGQFGDTFFGKPVEIAKAE